MGAGLGEIEEPVFLYAGVQRTVRVVAPVGQQAVETDRIDHHAREDMGADFRALFHDHDRNVAIVTGSGLADADRGSQPGRACTHDHDIEFHRFALRK
jgi:hypothetical protein